MSKQSDQEKIAALKEQVRVLKVRNQVLAKPTNTGRKQRTLAPRLNFPGAHVVKDAKGRDFVDVDEYTGGRRTYR